MALISSIKRDSITILADILQAVSFSKPAKKMTIVYKANLNFERIKKYLDLLIATGLVETVTTTKGDYSYQITTKGREFLVGYERLVEYLRTQDTGRLFVR